MAQISPAVEEMRPPESPRRQKLATATAESLPTTVEPTVVAVTAIGDAEGSRAAAAALACAGADEESASLLIDVGGRLPRPTLLASAGARRLEESLAAQLSGKRAAARGRFCQLSVCANKAGLDVAAAAVSLSSVERVVLHLPPLLAGHAPQALEGVRTTGVLLRADLPAARFLVTPVVRDLMAGGISVGILKRRLGWVAERRALFGALAPDAPDGLPPFLMRRFLGGEESPVPESGASPHSAVHCPDPGVCDA